MTATAWMIVGFVCSIGTAVSLLGYRSATMKEATRREQAAIAREEQAVEERASLMKAYYQSIQVQGIKLAQELAHKYPLGYVLFGVLDGSFLYPTTAKNPTMRITADWNATSLSDHLSEPEYYQLTIHDLRQTGHFGANNTINLSVGKYIVDVPKNAASGTTLDLGLLELGADNVRIVFERLESMNATSPIYVIGFRE